MQKWVSGSEPNAYWVDAPRDMKHIKLLGLTGRFDYAH